MLYTFVFKCLNPVDVMRFRQDIEKYGGFIHCTMMVPVYSLKRLTADHKKEYEPIGYNYAVVYSHVCEHEIEVKTVGGTVQPDPHAAVHLTKTISTPFNLLPTEDQKILMKCAIDALPKLNG